MSNLSLQELRTLLSRSENTENWEYNRKKKKKVLMKRKAPANSRLSLLPGEHRITNSVSCKGTNSHEPAGYWAETIEIPTRFTVTWWFEVVPLGNHFEVYYLPVSNANDSLLQWEFVFRSDKTLVRLWAIFVLGRMKTDHLDIFPVPGTLF